MQRSSPVREVGTGDLNAHEASASGASAPDAGREAGPAPFAGVVESPRPRSFHRAKSSRSVHEIELRLEDGDGQSHNPDLFVAQKVAVLDQDDSWVKLSSTGELEEVVDIAGHEDAVIGVGTLEYLLVRRSQKSSIPNVNRINAVSAKGFGHPGGKVLIEQQLDVHAGVPFADRPSRRQARTQILVVQVRVVLRSSATEAPRRSMPPT